MTEDPGRGPSMGCKVLALGETRPQVGGRRDFKTGILRISIIYECLQFVIHCGTISYMLASQTHKINPYIYLYLWASLMAQEVKNLPANAGDTGSIPGSGRSPGAGMATHSNTLT